MEAEDTAVAVVAVDVTMIMGESSRVVVNNVSTTPRVLFYLPVYLSLTLLSHTFISPVSNCSYGGGGGGYGGGG